MTRRSLLASLLALPGLLWADTSNKFKPGAPPISEVHTHDFSSLTEGTQIFVQLAPTDDPLDGGFVPVQYCRQCGALRLPLRVSN